MVAAQARGETAGSRRAAAEADVPAGPVAESDAAPEFDLSSLPKLEDLTETTDITAFLRKGVPEHLRNAALRKSWALDPAIRNYVNPALDYAYDWNTPGGVPGSSEIGAGMDVARLVSQIMGSGESAAEPPVPAVTRERSRRAIPRNPQHGCDAACGGRICRPRLCAWAMKRIPTHKNFGMEGAPPFEASERSVRQESCCTATAGATPWLCETACLDKSF